MAVLMYPTDFPTAQLLSAGAILRKGELSAKRSRFAKDVFIIQGYSQLKAFGDPDVAGGVGEIEPMTEVADPPVTSDSDCADRIEKLCAGPPAGAEAFSMAGVFLRPIVAWLVKRAIDELMKKLQPAG